MSYDIIAFFLIWIQLLSATTEDDNDYILRSNDLDLEIVQQNITLKRVGRYVITGELENVGSYSARSIDVIATAYDSNGELIGVGFGWPAASVLAPDETSIFRPIFFGND